MSEGVVDWIKNILTQCNADESLEFEAKFAPQFQGIMLENFAVGIDSQTFNTILMRFETACQKSTKITKQQSAETITFFGETPPPNQIPLG